jgi:outer membrane receptor protein involved in Fe transport
MDRVARATVPVGKPVRQRRLAGLALTGLLTASSQPTLAAGPAISGTATDAQRHATAAVEIALRAEDGRIVAHTRTGADGRYGFADLAPGTYSLIASKAGFAPVTLPVTLTAAGATLDLPLAPETAVPVITVTAEREPPAHGSAVSATVGASTYSFSPTAIEAQPGGDNAGLNQVILQAPGVAQDSFGQLHIRNEHGNLQYRINGVILPQGVSFFGQSLTTRIAGAMDLITGALPAQYGLQTAGVVDIQTKTGDFKPGGSIGFYAGSQNWLQPSVEYAGSSGHFNYYVAGDFLSNDVGIENPTRSYRPLHDTTQQGHGFAYLEDAVDDTTSLSAILGVYRGQFQIPNNPGQAPLYPKVAGVTGFNSANLNESQRELNDYGVLSYHRTEQDYDVQVSGYSRYSSLTFSPDPLGDIAFTGIAQSAYRRSIADGVQADGSYKLASDHTLRAGLLLDAERAVSETTSLVLPASGTPDTPFAITGNGAKTGWTYSAYLQDEWHVTPTVTINYGGRFDVVNAYTNENQLSPRLNTVWKPTSSTTVHAGYANYFTPPPLELVSTTNIQAFENTSAATPSTGNSPVKAERSQEFDIGIDQQVLTGLKAGIDVYYKYSRNLIDEGQFGAPIILTPFNYHMGQNHGVELTTSYERENLSLYANLALAEQRAEGISSAQFNFSPAELAYIADHPISTDHSQSITASGGATYSWAATKFSADIIAGTGLRSGFANISSLPSYEQINLGVSHRFETAPGGPLEVRADLINVFDQIYEIRSGTGVGVGAPQYGPRRGLFLGFKKEF